MIKRGLVVAKIKPGSEEQVAKLFEESDRSELPRLAGVRHRSLFVLDDIYVHYVETDDDFAEAVDAVREHPMFREISAQLDAYITPYDPDTWRSPKDAQGARVLLLGSAQVALGELLEPGPRVRRRHLHLHVGDLPHEAA
jgi:cyclase